MSVSIPAGLDPPEMAPLAAAVASDTCLTDVLVGIGREPSQHLAAKEATLETRRTLSAPDYLDCLSSYASSVQSKKIGRSPSASLRGGVNFLRSTSLRGGVSFLFSTIGRQGSTQQLGDPKEVFEGLHELSLHCALGQTSQVRRLLTSGSRPDQRDNDLDRVPLHWAAARGRLNAIKLLLAANADPSLIDASGRTPADLALLYGRVHAFHLLAHGPICAEQYCLMDTELGHGSFSRVRLAMHREMRVLVAVKAIGKADVERAASIEAEVRLLRRVTALGHSNLMAFHEVLQTQTQVRLDSRAPHTDHGPSARTHAPLRTCHLHVYECTLFSSLRHVCASLCVCGGTGPTRLRAATTGLPTREAQARRAATGGGRAMRRA